MGKSKTLKSEEKSQNNLQKRSANKKNVTNYQKLVESPTKEQLYELDELHRYFKFDVGSAENTFVMSVIWMLIIRIIDSQFTLGYSEQNEELDKNILSSFEINDYISDETLYICSTMAISILAFWVGKKGYDYYWPLGLINSYVFGKKFDPKNIELAYENRAKAEKLIEDLKGKLDEAYIKQAIYFCTPVLNGMLNRSDLNNFTSIVPLSAMYQVFRIGWNYQNSIDKSKTLIDQQKELLDDIMACLSQSKLTWRAKDSTLSFELTINKPIKFNEFNISKRKIKAILIQAIRDIKSNYRVYEDTDGIILANANLTNNEAQQIKSKFSTGMANLANYAKVKNESKPFLKKIIDITEGKYQLISWYLEDMVDASGINNAMPRIVSTALDNWSTKDRDSVVAEIQKIAGAVLTIELQKDNRLCITKFPNLNAEQWSKLKEYFSNIKLPVKTEQPVSNTNMPQASDNTEQKSQKTSWEGMKQSFFEKCNKYIPTSLSQFFASNKTPAPAANKNLPVAMPSARIFAEYSDIPDYDPSPDYKTTLSNAGKVTIPLFHDRKVVGFIKLNKEIYSLPDGGNYAFSLIDDHLKQGGGHFIPLRSSSKYATQLGATHKLRIFGKTGGDPRGLLKRVVPARDNKDDVVVYDFSILEKHLKY